MTYEEKLAIAKEAYKQIMEGIKRAESSGVVCCHWDECITVDDELFHSRHMREHE